MKIRLINLLLFALIAATSLFGQEKPDARQHLEPIYQHLDPDKISTGILHNKVISFAPFRFYDGRDDVAPLTASVWRQLYHELTAAQVRDIGFAPVADIRRETSQHLRQNITPLAIINQEYNTMRADAVKRGMVVQNGREFADGPNDRVSPYLENHIFAASPLKSTLYGLQQNFRILDYSAVNSTTSILWEVDFGDGQGFQNAKPGQLLQASFPSAGHYIISTKLTDESGQRLSRSTIEILLPEWSKNGSTIPDIIRENQVATTPYLGSVAGYDAYVFLGEGNAEITRPVLVVEGFDLENNIGWQEIFDRLSVENVAQDLIADGYDLVIMNFSDATDYIQRNAFAVVHLIGWLKEEKPSTEPITIAGVSMGGLVARYALSWMEDQNLQHDTQTLLSFDAPQQGANIPLGLQYWVWFFSNYNEKADLYREIVNSPGAKQMLVTQYNFFPGTSTLRTDLFSELTSLGEYPQHWMLRKVALASGSGAGFDARQVNNNGSFMSPGSRLIEWRHRSFLVDVDGDVWAVPDVSPRTQIFEGLVNIWGPQNESVDIHVNGTIPYDNAPGGWSNTNQQIADEEPEITVLGQNVKLGDIRTNFPNHNFIYFASALDLRDSNGDPLDVYYDAEADPDLLAKSPFDTVYYPSGTANQAHLTIEPENAAFILEQVNYLPQVLTVKADTIEGQRPTAKARQELITENTVTVAESGDIAFVSGNRITLKPGFSVQSGADFRATTDVSLANLAPVRKQRSRNSDITRLPNNALKTATADENKPNLPAKFVLHQNYPNPFNPTTTIEFELPMASSVRLEIFDLMGKSVKTHHDVSQQAGTHKYVWNGTNQSGNQVVSGVYFYRLRAGNWVETRKMMLMR